MGLLTKQDIDDFYDDYKNMDVVFTKKISSLLGLKPKHIYIKFKDVQRPCVIYSSSMCQAKIIINIPKNILEQLKKENSINLRFAVNNEDKKNDILFFFIKCKTIDISPYKPEMNLYIIQLEYTSKPPETLITILGRLLDARSNAKERKDERIVVDKTNISKLGLSSAAAQLVIDKIPRQSILRDISFRGIKVLLAGNAKFLTNKIVRLQLIHKDFGAIVLLGKTVRAEPLSGRKDIVALSVQFDEKYIPVEYNLLVSEYLKSQKIINKIKINTEANESKEETPQI